MNNKNQECSINVAQNIFQTIFVSTAMWATEINGIRYPTYETFIWEWDNKKKERGGIKKQYYHSSRKEALLFHFRLCRLISHIQLKQNLPSDNPWVNFN